MQQSYESHSEVGGEPRDVTDNPSLPDVENTSSSTTTSPLERRLDELGKLLNRLEPTPAADRTQPAVAEAVYENHLAQVRLGIASSLYVALRCKHAATASHSLRVAMGCSAWAIALELADEERDALEAAALLHDIGKIGVPDSILLKPSALTAEEHALMDRHRRMGLGILESCCASQRVLDIVRYAPAWYDGSQMNSDRQGTDLPLPARMLAIVDAFDSMTTAQVYRPAMARERAIKELCDFAGTQFDPDLVVHFAHLHTTDHQKLDDRVARRWLQQLDPETSHGWWQAGLPQTIGPAIDHYTLFPQKLLDNMYDGVIFLDSTLQVMLWNRGAERLTGINGSSMLQRPFTPSALHLRDERSVPFLDEECPIAVTVRSGVQSLRRMMLRGRGGKDVTVDIHTIPVVGPDGSVHGASLLLHDASGQASLEERCLSLHEKATRDPLTQLANRAELDRMNPVFVEAHIERHLPCSAIMCDIDMFKQVNDTYGHPAGDEVIRSFAQVLKSSCRTGDFAARYGGEEFVLLCADCDNAGAAARAEQLRAAFSQLQQPALGGRRCTASFGVTELQPGDNPQTLLNRADRALLLAKEGGRNMVVQLGSGMEPPAYESRRRWWFWQQSPGGVLAQSQLVTNVPLNIAVEKLRGFVSDHRAEIVSINGHHVQLIVHTGRLGMFRRQTDRPLPLIVDLNFEEEPESPSAEGKENRIRSQTRIHLSVRTKRQRDRRRASVVEQAKQVVAGLRSYLMATEVTAEVTPEVPEMPKKSIWRFSTWGR